MALNRTSTTIPYRRRRSSHMNRDDAPPVLRRDLLVLTGAAALHDNQRETAAERRSRSRCFAVASEEGTKRA
jgi:hypothetical protein